MTASIGMTLRKPGIVGAALLDKPVSISLCAGATHDLGRPERRRAELRMNLSTDTDLTLAPQGIGHAATDNAIQRVLVLEMVRVTERAAIAAAQLIGRGDEKAADAAAVEAMRKAFDNLYIDGTVVIGEGERDEAPMLYIGEKVGMGKGPQIDIALDPLEGTTITAKAGPNALAVLAAAEKGCLLNAPDTYMDKIAVGPGYPEGIIDLAKSPTENVMAVAEAKGVKPSDINVCVLDRPRHAELIAELRGIGCGVVLIGDGDVAGVIAVTDEDTTIDMYMGQGGAPEGVLAAAALRCVGGQFNGRLVFRNEDERARARKWGIEDLNRIYKLEDLAKGDCIFAATGVTSGSLLDGVKRRRRPTGEVYMTTESVVMRASSGTVRWIRGEHRIA
jgi:fructose-1,6-bisphosphatase II / sedoheptulose-1,7-bisphosphatase